MKPKRVTAFFLWFVLFLSLTAGIRIPTESKAKTSSGKIRLNHKSIVVENGKSAQLRLLGTEKKKLRSVKWSSSNSYNASVNQKGKVTGKRLGSVTVTAKVGKKKYRCKVRICSDIKEKDIPKVYNNDVFTKELSNQLKQAGDGLGTATVKDKLAARAIFARFASLRLTEVPHDKKYDDVMGGLSVMFILKGGEKLSASFKKDRLFVSNGKEYTYEVDGGLEKVGSEIRKLLDDNRDYGDWCYDSQPYEK